MSSVSGNSNAKKNNKVILLGDSGVGKTALIQRFTHNKFETKQNATIGIDFVGKNVTVHGHTYRLQLWDTAGQQRYRSLIPSYLKDAISAIFVYDITNPESLNNLQSWIQLYKESKADKSLLILCGNKMDMEDKKNYSEETLKFLKEKHSMKSFFASALSGTGVNEMFEDIIQSIHKQQQKKKKKFDDTIDVMPYSSQNLHSEEMMSNRSNKSKSQNLQASQQKPHGEQTVVKIQSSQKLKNSKVGSPEGVQGGTRCC